MGLVFELIQLLEFGGMG